MMGKISGISNLIIDIQVLQLIFEVVKIIFICKQVFVNRYTTSCFIKTFSIAVFSLGFNLIFSRGRGDSPRTINGRS